MCVRHRVKFVIYPKCSAIQSHNGPERKTGKETNLADRIKRIEPGVNDNLTRYVDRMKSRLEESGSLFGIAGVKTFLWAIPPGR